MADNLPAAPLVGQTSSAQITLAATTPSEATPAENAPLQSTAGQAAAAPPTLATDGKTTPPPSDSPPVPGRLSAPAPAMSNSASTPASPEAFLVQIRAREDSWVAISADGHQIMEATLFAAGEKSIGARDQIVIKTGNAGALDISFNGKKLPAQGGPNEVKTLTFDPHGPRF
jgi:cytoskeleton protein RodZ